MEELFAFVDGRAVTNNLSDLVQVRKKEFDSYRKVRRGKEERMIKECIINVIFYVVSNQTTHKHVHVHVHCMCTHTCMHAHTNYDTGLHSYSCIICFYTVKHNYRVYPLLNGS